MITPRFKKGDHVYLLRRSHKKKPGVIAEVIYQPAIEKPGLIVGEDGSTHWGTAAIKEQYLYKIDGEGIPDRWFTESLIDLQEEP